MIVDEDLDDIQDTLVGAVEEYAENYFKALTTEEMNYWSGVMTGFVSVLDILDPSNHVFITLGAFVESVLNNPSKVIPNKNIQ